MTKSIKSDFLEGGEFNEGQVQEFVDYIKLTKGLSKSQMQAFSGDKYAKMEKAKFLLEQEGYELDKILFDMKKGKDEVDSFLKTSLNFKHVTSSGASKILENMLRRLRSEEFLFNYDSLLKAIGNFNFN